MSARVSEHATKKKIVNKNENRLDRVDANQLLQEVDQKLAIDVSFLK